MSNSVTFWTEGGPSIGMGHVSRCMSIAGALSSMGIASRFFINDDNAVIGRLKDSGFDYSIVPQGAPSVPDVAGGVVVMDTKRDIRRSVSILKETGKKVVVIDNMATADIADAAVMPYADIKGGKRGDNLYSGSPYAVIGESFIRARLAARPRARGSLIPRTPPPPLKLLVTMGGADPNNLTDKVVEALWDMKDVEAAVVIGPASQPSLWLRSRMMDNNSGFVFVEKAADLSGLMASAHIAFTAVGITVYELAYMGVPSVIIANYKEDKAFLDALANAGFSLPLGYHGDVTHQSIREAASRFIKDRALLEDMSMRAANFTDGLGAGRIAGIIARLGAAPASSC